jgi:peroxin-5
MALRDLVMGGSGCAVPGSDGSSSSNPLGGLADSILGSASKSQERLREMPGLAGPGQQNGPQLGPTGPLTSLPGSELDFGQGSQQAQVFLPQVSSCCGASQIWKRIPELGILITVLKL